MIEIPDLSVPVERASRIRDFEERICQAGKERLETGKDGLQVAAKLAGYRIGLLKALYDSADPPSSLALLVTGGLGRNIASPYSDFDLVFLRGSLTDEDIEAFLQRFLYPLWDAGLTVGHTVHTAASYLDLALEDLTVLTSVLDRHSVAGSEALTDELDRLADARLREEPFRQAMLQAVRTWTDGINSATAHRLEPDIKSGAGGLRTLHEVWWAARFVWNINSWRDLPNNDLLEAHDVEVLMYGFRLLLEVRLALHFEAGRRQDSLRFEFQSRVAERLGVGDDAHDLASANRLLSVVYRTKRAIRSAADRALEVCLEDLLADGDTLGHESGSMTNERYGQLVFDPVGDESSITAESVMALFGEAQRQDKPIHWTARTRISELGPTLFTPEACISPAVADLFMEIIATSDDQGATLEAIHEAGILERLLPEFVPVTGLVQRDLYHIYTVDAHLVQTGRVTLELLAGNAKHPEDFREIASRVASPHVLVMSALMHDIGKGYGHGHAKRGADMCVTLTERLGWAGDEADDLAFLVLEHLSMMIISQRRDMEDTGLIERFAEKVETVARLELLTLLTYADAVSTGPEAYNGWKASLLRELYYRTKHALDGGAGGLGLQERANQRCEQLLMSHGDSSTLTHFLTEVTPRHILYHRPSILLEQADLFDRALKQRAAVKVVADPRRKRWEIILVTKDRPGYLFKTAGVLAAYGIRPQSALLSITQSEFSIDSYVTHTSNWPLLCEEGLRKELEQAMESAALHDVVPEAKLQEMERAEQISKRDLNMIEPRVIFDSHASERATVIEVFATSSVMLLMQLATALFESKAYIQLARISREGRKTIGAFYVVDVDDRKPLTPERRIEVKRSLISHLNQN